MKIISQPVKNRSCLQICDVNPIKGMIGEH